MSQDSLAGCTDKDDSEFHDCEDNMLYYNDRYNIVIFSKHAGQFNPGFIDNFVKSPFRTIIDAIANLVTGDSQESLERSVQLIGETKDFTAYYLSASENKIKVAGAKETVFEKDEDDIIPHNTVNVQYNGLTRDLCSSVPNQLQCRQTNPDREGLMNATVFRTEQLPTFQSRQIIDMYWKELTAKTR